MLGELPVSKIKKRIDKLDEWEIYYNAVKNTLEGTDEEKEGILRRRLLKFFTNYSLEEDRFYIERREIKDPLNPFLTVMSRSLLLYGTDFMTEAKIHQYFLGFDIEVNFYDDSHCEIVFQSSEKAREAIVTNINRFTAMNEIDFQSNQKSSSQIAFMQQLEENPTRRLKWIQLRCYYQLCFQRKLWVRFMTNFDMREKGEYRRSNIHQAYILAKNNFINGLMISKTNQTTIDDSMAVRQRSRDKKKTRQNLCLSNKDSNKKSKSKYFQHKGCCCCCCCQNHKKRKFNNFYQAQNKIEPVKKMLIKNEDIFSAIRNKKGGGQITRLMIDRKRIGASKEVKQKEIKKEYEMRQQEDDSSIRQLLKQLNRLNEEPNLLEEQKEKTLSDYSLFEFQIQE